MASLQSPVTMQSSVLLETSCGYFLQELQMIWDEVGEDQFEREKVLLDLEQECLDVYRRKVDRANISRARLHQELAESEAEFTHLLLTLGECSIPGQLYHLGKALTNLWNLMDTPYTDRRKFSHVTSLLTASSAEVSEPGSLTNSIIEQAESEVKRLDQLKASKMKELFLKKQNELEKICNNSHMEIPSQSEMDKILNLLNSGEIDHADLLMSMDEQISRAKEEASSRKVIMEKVERWMLARDEERWLEEYSMDENRYSVSRGAHRNLRRAERARIMVKKISALVDSLIAMTKSWEEERNKVFLYDEVPLLAMLEEYNMARQEREEEKQRQREKKKVQSQVVVEQENVFGSRPGTSNRRISNRSLNGGFSHATPLNRRISMSIQQLGTHNINSATQGISFIKEERKVHEQKMFARSGLACHFRDETASVVSTVSGPLSP